MEWWEGWLWGWASGLLAGSATVGIIVWWDGP
jgi:hypothetical protein